MAAEESVKQIHHVDRRESIELGPPIEDRASLKSAAEAGTVEFYLLTGAASRAWATIAATLARGSGTVFWLGGAGGAGKTHFLNYLTALEERAGMAQGRHAILRLDLEGRAGAHALEQQMFDLLAREIGAGDTGAALWRRLHGGEALGLALERACRVGIRAVSMAVDLGAADASAWVDYFAELARAAAQSRPVAFNVYAAARGRAPAGAVALDVAPADERERMLAALTRARRVLIDDAAAAALYRNSSLGGLDARALFPFHPLALDAIGSLAGEAAGVAALARLIGAALAAWREDADRRAAQPLMPIDLMRAAAIARRAQERLGEAGRAALRIAYRAADAMEERGRARAIVDALMLERLSADARALAPGELRARLAGGDSRADARPGPPLEAMLQALAAHSGSVVAFDGRRARFNPHAAGAPEVAAFSQALGLLRRFDSTLGEAGDLADLRLKLGRASQAMARAVDGARTTAEALETIAREARAAPDPAHRQVLDEYIGLAEAGPKALAERAGDPHWLARAEQAISAYESLAAVASMAPRMREMRDYLRATAILPQLTDDPERDAGATETDRAIAGAQIECQLLLAALESGVPRWDARAFDALEVRFQKFRWNYIQLYRSSHERWRREQERFALELADARAHFAALTRLNRIAALGPPSGAALEPRIEELARSTGRCAPDVPLALELAPRCPRCGFVLGTRAPLGELREVLEETRRALEARLSALSHGAIARLIRLHDRGHRLDGLLKIIQAAQTDALVRVLDDNLARYVARLLDEVRDGRQVEAAGVIQPFVRPGGGEGLHHRVGRAAKTVKPPSK